MCWIRLDFETFAIAGPADSLEITGGTCNTDSFKVTVSLYTNNMGYILNLGRRNNVVSSVKTASARLALKVLFLNKIPKKKSYNFYDPPYFLNFLPLWTLRS